VLTDRGTEYCGNPEHHEYELYLALEDIDNTNKLSRLELRPRTAFTRRGDSQLCDSACRGYFIRGDRESIVEAHRGDAAVLAK